MIEKINKDCPCTEACELHGKCLACRKAHKEINSFPPCEKQDN